MQQNPDDILEALRRPLGRKQPGVLRLGLVLNGTVSAGAWTAGALDALIEALDAWEAQRAAPVPGGGAACVPRHRVRLEILGGASGGAVCAAAFAQVIGHGFPHGPQAGNPFWDLWVEGLDIAGMLHTGEGMPPAPVRDPYFPAASLLSGHAIRTAAQVLLQWPAGKAPVQRAWVAPGLRVLLTQTNLRGVPYTLPLRSAPPGAKGGAAPLRRRPATSYRAHADHVAFAFDTAGDLRPDEFPLRPGVKEDWARLAQHARASGAFPIGFPPVRLERPGAHYDWRAVMLPGEPDVQGRRGPARARPLRPNWGGPAPEVYHYDAVDGGALNNSPFALVHQRMAGLGGALSRDELDPDGAIIVIDPLAAMPADPGAYPLDPGQRIATVAGLLLPALVAQGRFSASELMLATDDDVASRHLFTAGRKRRDGTEEWGEAAIAGSGLGAFLGFLDRKIREHDFLLGRSNMRAWLTRHFVLDSQSRLFGTPIPSRPGTDQPIIPLLGPAALPAGQPSWPGGICPKHLRGEVKARLRAAVARQFDRKWLGAGLGRVVDYFATDGAMQALEAALAELEARR
jgi:hypothetical protein